MLTLILSHFLKVCERSLYESVHVCVRVRVCVVKEIERGREREERYLKSETDDKADVFEIGVQIKGLTSS